MLAARTPAGQLPARRDLARVAGLGLCLYFNQLFYIIGIDLSGVVVATCMQPTIPVFTAAIAVALHLEAGSAQKLAGIGLAVGGSICMARPPAAPPASGRRARPGGGASGRHTQHMQQQRWRCDGRWSEHHDCRCCDADSHASLMHAESAGRVRKPICVCAVALPCPMECTLQPSTLGHAPTEAWSGRLNMRRPATAGAGRRGRPPHRSRGPQHAAGQCVPAAQHARHGAVLPDVRGPACCAHACAAGTRPAGRGRLSRQPDMVLSGEPGARTCGCTAAGANASPAGSLSAGLWTAVLGEAPGCARSALWRPLPRRWGGSGLGRLSGPCRRAAAGAGCRPERPPLRRAGRSSWWGCTRRCASRPGRTSRPRWQWARPRCCLWSGPAGRCPARSRGRSRTGSSSAAWPATTWSPGLRSTCRPRRRAAAPPRARAGGARRGPAPGLAATRRAPAWPAACALWPPATIIRV